MKPEKKRFASVVLALAALMLSVTSCRAVAGIALGATRVVYPAGQKQVSLPVSSSDADGAFLIQSWVENAQDQKDAKLIVTPPLFMMQGKKENILRIIDASADSLPRDKETLFWLNVRAIPSTSPSQAKGNVLQIAVTTRIKLFYRPKNLSVPPEKAPEMLRFQRDGRTLRIMNTSPYYVTVAALRLADTPLGNTMVPPDGSVSVPLKNAEGSRLSYQTINDYGALTPAISVTL
ncbi:fimbria/pilus periplasmic chaperone [Pantoea ananatis]|uniref:Periplasmic chaperone n=1 Tax=Pantoea ananatis (strain AJ13355) TaxID=932677 RepID=A0A0H3KZF3_PANAA|nr:fimbria/pilus periplasmic chaperone [Pantoea ananatis]ASN18090.1 fimbrial chaperone protein FimC [Pantoea ananatis]PQK73565.1 fimbrial chaperone protein FimC [Pantoea ananatis]PQK82039.1 fimbrial chaperone protein FimC [Pantoea ananatis]BAK11025.1 putative periplasmic chaperone precursor [Pantoea ananatis AJ13355]